MKKNAYNLSHSSIFFISLRTSRVPLFSADSSANELLWLYKRHTPDIYPVVYHMPKFGSTGLFYGEDVELNSLQGYLVVADLYTGYLFLADLLNSLQGDSSIRVSQSAPHTISICPIYPLGSPHEPFFLTRGKTHNVQQNQAHNIILTNMIT